MIKHSIAIAAGALTCSLAPIPLFGDTEPPLRSVEPSENEEVTIVENRKLTGSATLDLGRHMRGTSIGKLTVNGGSLTDDAGTRIQVMEGGFAEFSNGLRLSAPSGITFDGPDQSVDLDVAYTGTLGVYETGIRLGAYSIEGFKLPASSQYVDHSGVTRNEFGGTWTVEAEYGNITGETRTFTNPVSGRTDLADPADLSIGGDRPYIRPTIQESAGNAGIDWELDRGSGVIVKERVNPLIMAEEIPGSALDLSGIEVSLSGTALRDRRLGTSSISTGRVMVGSETTTIDRTDTVTIRTMSGTPGSDDVATRLHVSSFDREAEGIRVVHAEGADFTSGDATSDVVVTGSFERTTAELGRHSVSVNVDGVISSLENDGAGLAGEDVQSGVSLGYHWNVVDNNRLVAKDLVILENEDYVPGNRDFSNSFWRPVQHEYSTATHTEIGFDDSITIQEGYESGKHDLGTTTLSVGNGRIWGEGLEGETVTTEATSFNTYLVVMKDAEHSVTASREGPLQADDSISIADEGEGIYQAYTRIEDIKIRGGDRLDYEIQIDGDIIIDRNDSTTIAVKYVGENVEIAEGGLGVVRRTNLAFNLGHHFDRNGAIPEGDYAVYDDLDWDSLRPSTPYSYTLETRFDVPASASGTATLGAGSNLRQTGISLENTGENTGSRFATATKFEVVDSGTLEEEREITATFTKVEDLAPTSLDALESNSSNEYSRAGFMLPDGEENVDLSFSSDVISLSGLDGVLHTVELSYDGSLAGTHQVVWETTFDVEGESFTAWVNAVLGNSNIEKLNLVDGNLEVGGVTLGIGEYLEDNFVASSYDVFLQTEGSPTLGAWGVDTEALTAWAVIDHNSNFASAIPEPSTYALLFGLAGLTVGILRRRRRQETR